jgi:hypothetical protein
MDLHQRLQLEENKGVSDSMMSRSWHCTKLHGTGVGVCVGPTYDQGFLHVLGGKYFITLKGCFCSGVKCIVLLLFHLLQYHLGPWHYSINYYLKMPNAFEKCVFINTIPNA